MHLSPFQHDVDVFNCLNVMENTEDVMRKMKFLPGDGHLNYYLVILPFFGCVDLLYLRKPMHVSIIIKVQR